MITFSDTTTSDSIFYQKVPFVGYSHVQGLHAKSDTQWTDRSLQYVVTAFRTATKGKYDYATKFNRKLAADAQIYLPVTQDEEIDIQFMELFISAQQKLTIKGVVKWREEYISTTRQVAMA